MLAYINYNFATNYSSILMRTTEQESLYQNLENQTVFDLLTQMNQEDFKVPKAVSSSIPQINALIDNILPRMKKGGRLFYLGAGTSGRLGILDASECPQLMAFLTIW